MNKQIKQRINQINNGQVPEGYKKTKLGIFPRDWVTDKTFGDLFTFNGGLGKSREELSENGIEYLHYGDMHRSDFNVISFEQYSKLPKYNTEINGDESYLMKDGDVAFLDASEDLVGTSRAVLIDNPDNKPFIAGLHIIYGRSKDESLSKWFKQYITYTQTVKKQFQKLASGFKVYGINRDTLPKIQISYPKSTLEQEKIAEILMKWDEAVELQEKYINVLRVKRHSLLQNQFSVKNCTMKICVGDYISEISDRNNIDCTNIMSVSNKNGFIKQEEQFTKQVASENLKSYKIVKNGCVAYNPSRINVGSIAIYKEETEGIVSPMYEVFNCHEISPQFLLLALETARGKYEIQSFLSGSVRQSLSLNDMKKITLPVPEKNKWESIVLLFESINNYIQKQVDYLQLLKTQRKVMQQYLLNGIVRVKQ